MEQQQKTGKWSLTSLEKTPGYVSLSSRVVAQIYVEEADVDLIIVGIFTIFRLLYDVAIS